MNSYVIAYVPTEGQPALSLSVALGNDEQARQLASRTAQRCHGVTLMATDADGMAEPMARWVGGVLNRIQNGNSDLAAMIDAGIAADAEAYARQMDDDKTEDAVSDEHDDEAHRYEGQCMKCKTKREFAGHVVELSNGSRQARGNCPVCGTAIVRMVARTTPLDDDWENDPEVVSEVNAEADAQDDDPEIANLTEEVEEAIADVAEGAPIADVAEVTTALALEFSNAAEEAEQPPTPRKRAAKKATDNSDKRTPNQRAAANPTKAKCPQCEQSVDVIERAGIRIFTLHGDESKNLERCPGSTTVVQG